MGCGSTMCRRWWGPGSTRSISAGPPGRAPGPPRAPRKGRPPLRPSPSRAPSPSTCGASAVPCRSDRAR
ncbi:hypothetical protein ADK36_27835, partial [Streptomyces viridochromogenes]